MANQLFGTKFANLRTMKINVLIFFSVLTYLCSGQNVAPIIDFSGYFKTMADGNVSYIEFQPIKEFKGGDELVGYIDTRGNLKVFNGIKSEELSKLNVEYTVSDHFLVWKVGRNINLWDSGQTKNLTYYGNRYEVKDSLIVFEDTQFNSVNVYYNGKVIPLYTSAIQVEMPDYIGENIIAFKDNGNFYKVFWRGIIYDFDVWHNEIQFECGTDILIFNDPIMGTCTVFENGEFLDVEGFAMNDFKAGRGFACYINPNSELMLYRNGVKTELSNFRPGFWDVRDDMIIWYENGTTYAYQFTKEKPEGIKIEVARYKIEEYLMKNEVLAFRNLMGGVSAVVDGKVVDLTNQMDASFEIYGNGVLVKLFNRSYIYYIDGRKIEE